MIRYINVLVYCSCIEDNKVIGINKELQRNIHIEKKISIYKRKHQKSMVGVCNNFCVFLKLILFIKQKCLVWFFFNDSLDFESLMVWV